MATRRNPPNNASSVEPSSVPARRVDSAVAHATAGEHFKRLLRQPGTVSLLLALLTFAVFIRAGSADFVNYDDADYVTANSHVQHGLSWNSVVWAFTSGQASNWHPLTWLSHLLDRQMFGPGPASMHVVNVLLHVLNSVLVFLVLRRATGAHWQSAAVAALFALHPLHVESVAWVSERKDVLSTLFLLCCLWVYLLYVEASAARAPRSRVFSRYALALALFALGLMAKPMLVTLPFLLLLLDYWPLARSDGSPSKPGAPPRATCDWPHLVLEKVPFLLLAAASSVVTLLVQQTGGAVSTSLPLGGRLANAVVSYARYLGKVFYPVKLSVLYPHPGYWPVWAVVGAALLVVALFVVALWQRRDRPWLTVGGLWFVGGLVPVIGIVQVGIQSMADRYTYIPSIGLFLALVWVASEALSFAFGARAKQLACVFAGLLLAVLSWLSYRQIGFWYNSETLFSHAVQVTPKNYLAYNNLGYYLSNQGRSTEAMEYYAKSLAINPNYEDALNNVGYALAGQKKYSEAIDYYERALLVRPNQVEVHNNLGNALSELGRIPEAIEQYSFVLQKNPEHADAHNNLGIALAMQGKLDDAVAHFQDAIRLKPNYASAHSNLGNAYAVQRKFDQATREYLDSLRLNPADAQAHNNLGNVLSELGRFDEAISHYREALRLNSNNPEAHFNLGLALARHGQRPESVAHLTEALRLKPDYTEARKQLELLTGTEGTQPAVPR